MGKIRVSASMSMLVAEERVFVEQWKKSLPRRRQQWLREQIYLGVGSGATVISYRSGHEDISQQETNSTDIVRVQIELDDRDPGDQKAIEIYSSMSKTRRGQWLRNILILGNRILTNQSNGLVNVSTMFVSMPNTADDANVKVVEARRKDEKKSEPVQPEQIGLISEKSVIHSPIAPATPTIPETVPSSKSGKLHASSALKGLMGGY